MSAKKSEHIYATHFNRKPLRTANFIKPINHLRSKLGYGGLSDDIIEKAQALLESNATDFVPLGELYLDDLQIAITETRTVNAEIRTRVPAETESLIAGLIYPAMQLKANGGMFHYPLVTKIGDKLIQFLEVIAAPDPDALEIIQAFHTSLRAVIMGRITGQGGKHGEALIGALDGACTRYFERE